MKLLADVVKAIFLFEKFARFTCNARSMSFERACNFSHSLATARTHLSATRTDDANVFNTNAVI